ncbi:hypothetical protein [uncultured Vibrio sp.]|nr:hypothetical protein [uncultured Vibrio sp.]
MVSALFEQEAAKVMIFIGVIIMAELTMSIDVLSASNQSVY